MEATISTSEANEKEVTSEIERGGSGDTDDLEIRRVLTPRPSIGCALA